MAAAAVMALVTSTTTGVLLTVRVTPRAGRTAVAGVKDDVLLVKLAAAPVEGAANEALVELLAKAFDLPKRDVRVVSGERSRNKRVELTGVSQGAAEKMVRGMTG
jgi:uncharacterized protein (TIGR00251 family)